MYWALTRSSTRVTRLIKTDAQDHRGSLDRHSHHVAALTYSMNALLQIAYDISFPPIGIYRAVLSLNITILNVWFPIESALFKSRNRTFDYWLASKIR